MMIQPIETLYAGCRFRSRLEARWAVFFDALGIVWEYEPEGYALDEETWYLPDFLLPEFEVWCEVKPLHGDFSFARRFAEMLEVRIWLCEGTPDLRLYELVDPHDDIEPRYAFPSTYKQRMWFEFPGYDEDFRAIHTEKNWPYDCHPGFFHAIRQARSARFERDDKGIRYKPVPF